MASNHSHGNTDYDAVEQAVYDVLIIHSTRRNQYFPRPASKPVDQQTVAGDDYDDADMNENRDAAAASQRIQDEIQRKVVKRPFARKYEQKSKKALSLCFILNEPFASTPPASCLHPPSFIFGHKLLLQLSLIPARSTSRFISNK